MSSFGKKRVNIPNYDCNDLSKPLVIRKILYHKQTCSYKQSFS